MGPFGEKSSFSLISLLLSGNGGYNLGVSEGGDGSACFFLEEDGVGIGVNDPFEFSFLSSFLGGGLSRSINSCSCASV